MSSGGSDDGAQDPPCSSSSEQQPASPGKLQPGGDAGDKGAAAVSKKKSKGQVRAQAARGGRRSSWLLCRRMTQ